MVDMREYLKYRVYYAARDGLAMPLYTLLCELPKEEVNQLLDEVSVCRFFVLWRGWQVVNFITEGDWG